MVWVRRPVIWITFAYIIGIIVGAEIIREYTVFVWVAAILVVCTAWLLEYKRDAGFILILVAFGLVGVVSAQRSLKTTNPLADVVDKTVHIQGQIVDSPRYMDGRDVYVIETYCVTADGDRKDVKTRIQVTVYPERQKKERLRYDFGELVEIRGRLEQPSGQRNPGGFDYRAYLQRRGIYNIMTVYPYNIQKTGHGKVSLIQYCVHSLRARAQAVLDQHVGGEGGALLKTMLLGHKWLLPSEVRRDFQRTGLSHLLAVSGLHVGFIIAMLTGLTRLLHLTKKQSFVFQMAMLCLYCMIVGAAPSVVRASVMAALILGSRVVGRQSDMLNNLFMAALVILLFRPLDLFEVGFQLSFGAVIGIIMFIRHFENWLKFLPRWMASGLSVTLSAQLGVWPVIAHYFNTFSAISIVANLFLVPLAGMTVMLGFILMVGGMVIPPLGSLLAPVVEVMCTLLLNGNVIFAALPWAFIRVVSPSLLFLACYYLSIWILSQDRPGWINHPLLCFKGMTIVLLLAGILAPALKNDLEVVFLDVGQGDCIYIRTPDEKHILIDGGGKSSSYTGSFDVGQDVVVPFLLKNGIGHLDLVVMSHAHDDHIGGLVPVLENITVKAFMEYPPGEENENYVRLKRLVSEKGIQSIYAHAGLSYRIGRYVWMDVIYPEQYGAKLGAFFDRGDNNRSLVLLLRYKDASILFTGDIEADVEEYLSSDWDFKVDILKVAHHGSNTSSTDVWLDAIKPKLAVIQVGKNSFGHPNSEVLQRLEGKDIKVLRNDCHGAVVASYIKGEWRIRWMVNEP
jgi:competence protein ComEC